MSNLEKLNDDIVKYIDSQGRVKIQDIASKFDLCPKTIQRKIRKFETILLVEQQNDCVISLNNKIGHSQNVQIKTPCGVGNFIANLMGSEQTVFISSSPFSEEIAKAIVFSYYKRVVTNDIRVAKILSLNPEHKVSLLGGSLSACGNILTPSSNFEHLLNMRFDYGILGAEGFLPEGCFTHRFSPGYEILETIMSVSAQNIITLGLGTLDKASGKIFAQISDLDYLVTDQVPSAEILSTIHDSDVVFHMCSPRRETKKDTSCLEIK